MDDARVLERAVSNSFDGMIDMRYIALCNLRRSRVVKVVLFMSYPKTSGAPRQEADRQPLRTQRVGGFHSRSSPPPTGRCSP